MKRLARDELVEQFDYDVEKSIGLYEACVGGKHRSPFTMSTTETTVPLELVHSDVCVKMQ